MSHVGEGGQDRSERDGRNWPAWRAWIGRCCVVRIPLNKRRSLRNQLSPSPESAAAFVFSEK
jgi:hypothetical protein